MTSVRKRRKNHKSFPLYHAATSGKAAAIQQFPLLAVKFYTTLSAAHSNSPLPVYDRPSRRFFQTEPLTTPVDWSNPSRARRNLPITTRCRCTRLIIVTPSNQWRLGRIQRGNGSPLLPSIKQRFEQVAHRLQSVVIEQRSHPLPQPTFAPEFGPHCLE